MDKRKPKQRTMSRARTPGQGAALLSGVDRHIGSITKKGESFLAECECGWSEWVDGLSDDEPHAEHLRAAIEGTEAICPSCGALSGEHYAVCPERPPAFEWELSVLEDRYDEESHA